MNSEQDLTVNDADDSLSGEVRAPISELVIAKPIRIEDICADIKQPRRAIPAAVRGEWTGDAAGVFELLSKWQNAAAISTDTVRRLVMGNGDGRIDSGTDDHLSDGLISLCALAASILKEGLTNPIIIVPHFHGTYLIESGERRWLAHHLLYQYAHDKYKKMAARVVDTFDIYRQASENGSRKPLNAISMARQLAVLVMDMYPQEKFESYDFMVLPGQCDRAYYAQVAKGSTWSIKDGMGQRVLDVTGLKSRKQVSDYRALLSMSDADWNDADAGDWTENYCRGVIAQGNRQATIQDKKHQEALEEDAQRESGLLPPGNNDDVLPVVDIEQSSNDVVFGVGDKVGTSRGGIGHINSISKIGGSDRRGPLHYVRLLTDLPDAEFAGYYADELTFIEKHKVNHIIRIGDLVDTPSDGRGLVLALTAMQEQAKVQIYDVHDAGDGDWYYLEYLTFVPPAIHDDNPEETEISEIINQFSGGDRVVTNDGHGRFWKQLDETQCGIQLDGENIDVIGYELANVMLESEWPGMEIGDRVQHNSSGHVVEVKSFEIGHPITWAWCDTGDGIPRQFDISKLTIVSRNTVVEPAADDDDVTDSKQINEVELGSIVSTPDGEGVLTVIGITGYRVMIAGENYDQFFKFEEVEFLDANIGYSNQESGVYVPESHEDATSIVSVENPGLSKILSALSTYFHLHEELDVDIEWSLDDLMISRGQLEHELDTENNLDKYINDMAAISKNLRLYLEHIAGVIDNWCIELEQIAADYVEGGNDAES